MRSLVARCGFLSWLPDALLSAGGMTEAIQPLMIPGAHMPHHIAIYRRRHGILSSPAVKLIEELRRVVKSLDTAALPDSKSE